MRFIKYPSVNDRTVVRTAIKKNSGIGLEIKPSVANCRATPRQVMLDLLLMFSRADLRLTRRHLPYELDPHGGKSPAGSRTVSDCQDIFSSSSSINIESVGF